MCSVIMNNVILFLPNMCVNSVDTKSSVVNKLQEVTMSSAKGGVSVFENI